MRITVIFEQHILFCSRKQDSHHHIFHIFTYNMISEIFIGDEAFEGFKSVTPPKDEALQKLSRVNVFIGPNNSGKSRFLRTLFSDKELSFQQKGLQNEMHENNVRLSILRQNIIQALGDNEIRFDNGVGLHNVEQLKVFPYLKMNDEIDGILKNNLSTIEYLIRNIKENAYNSYRITQNITQELGRLKNGITAIIDASNKKKYERYYIPILRGLRPIAGLHIWHDFDGSKNPYNDRTIRDYFEFQKQTIPQPKISESIFTGLEIYEDIKTKLLNSKEYRKRISEFENFLKINFFPDKEISLIPKTGEDVLEIGISEGKEIEERLIYHLGDGIQAIIQMLYPIFMRKDEDALFFIEEPELSLHPGMQRLFLNTLLSDEFSSMQFFFTTHSNHFLDMTTDNENVSIYSFKKNGKDSFQIRTLEGPDNHVLNEIGVRNSSVFLANCSIWVEGVTERKYIRRFLQVYNQNKSSNAKYIEDLHYTFVEYGGSNIVHWDFDDAGHKESENIKALRMNNKIFLIADSDIDEHGKQKPGKKNRHDSLRKELGDKLYITEGKEIENILSPTVIEKIIKDYERTNDLEFGDTFYKTVNAGSFNSEAKIEKPIYWKYNLGEFIDEKVSSRNRTYKKGSSISDKTNFCQKAIKKIETIEDLSEEAIILCGKIMKFVEESNAE